MKFSVIILPTAIFVLLANVCHAYGQSSTTTTSQISNSASQTSSLTANPADVASVDAIIARLYEGISGAAGKQRDWNRERALYLPGARLIAVGKRRTGEVINRVMSIEDYIAANSALLEKEGFFEKEVARRAEVFGNIVHVWSTYEARHKVDDAQPFMRGINSIQLVNDGKRWWIMTILWQAENPDTKLPEKYLKTING